MEPNFDGSVQLVLQGLQDEWKHTRFVEVYDEVIAMSGHPIVNGRDHDDATSPLGDALSRCSEVMGPYSDVSSPPHSERSFVDGRYTRNYSDSSHGHGDDGGESMPGSQSTANGGSESSRQQQQQQQPAQGVAGSERSQAWWSMGEFLQPNARADGAMRTPLTHQSARLTLAGSRVFRCDEAANTWDASDSLAELAAETRRRNAAVVVSPRSRRGTHTAVAREWLARDAANGYIRVYAPDGHDNTGCLVPCTLTTSAHRLCLTLGIAAAGLHVQYGGGVVRRVESHEHPLMMQYEHLVALGYTNMQRIQAEGDTVNLAYLIRFYLGKPTFDSTFSRTQLRAFIDVRKGKMLQGWQRRMCVLSGTRLLIYKDASQSTNPTIVQLAKGAVEAIKFKDHDLCLKLTATLQGERYIFLSFSDFQEFNTWHRKCKKATDKLPTSADLSHCHLEFLPEPIFINDKLVMLNLRHNALKERPTEEDIYTIGWLDDLPRFSQLRSLNLADNGLTSFPVALCAIQTLVELNIASNKLESVPPQIAELTNLQALHIHNNHLSSLPDEMVGLRRLFILVLAFNHFSSIPPVVSQLTDVRISEVENIILAGNQIQSVTSADVSRMRHVKKVDLRMNELRLPPHEVSKFSGLEHLTHLDIRDNMVSELDLRVVRTLEYLNCERNCISQLMLNGTALKCLYAAHNNMEKLMIAPKPEWLLQMNVSHNFLDILPDWLSDCFFLHKLNACHNLLRVLPSKLLVDAKKLKSLRINHNRLLTLPVDVDGNFLEEVHLQHNHITRLPGEFLAKSNKLRILNLTKNRLSDLPPLNTNPDLNRVQELYLTGNCLGDSAVSVLAGYPRLKVLHLAYNEIETLQNHDIGRLEMLQELNLSGNQLRSLPDSLGRLPKLMVLRAHSNMLKSLPDFKQATALRVLDVGHNQLFNISVTNLMASQINLLDMCLNTALKVDPKEFNNVKCNKSVCLVDMTGQNRTLPGLRPWQQDSGGEEGTDPSQPWKVGFSETSGTRNKLCVSMLRMLQFGNENQAVFAMFDGGQNGEVPQILRENVPDILAEELAKPDNEEYMRYTLLEAHKRLRGAGQRLGASGVLCHIRRDTSANLSQSSHDSDGTVASYTLNVANVGDTEAVLCRGGEAVILTRRFVTTDDVEECVRVHQSDGIITEDNKVNGTTRCTRLLGCTYLNPHVIPDPSCLQVALRHDDEFVIIANGAFWKSTSPTAAVDEVYAIGNPVVAAKRLQDVAQACGARENVAVLVLRLNTDGGPSLGRLRRRERSMSIDDVDAVVMRSTVTHRRPSLARYRSTDTDWTSGDEFIQESINIDGGSTVGMFSRGLHRASRRSCSELALRPLPRQRYVRRATAAGWQDLLQRRLVDDLKEKEMKQVSGSLPDRRPVAPPRRRRPGRGAVDIDSNGHVDRRDDNPHDPRANVSTSSSGIAVNQAPQRSISAASGLCKYDVKHDQSSDSKPPSKKPKPPVPPRRFSGTLLRQTSQPCQEKTTIMRASRPASATDSGTQSVTSVRSNRPASVASDVGSRGETSSLIRAGRPASVTCDLVSKWDNSTSSRSGRAVKPAGEIAVVRNKTVNCSSPVHSPTKVDQTSQSFHAMSNSLSSDRTLLPNRSTADVHMHAAVRPSRSNEGDPARKTTYRRAASEDCRQRRRLVTVERDERAALARDDIHVTEFYSDHPSRVPGLASSSSGQCVRRGSLEMIAGVSEINGDIATLNDDDVTVVEIARL